MVVGIGLVQKLQLSVQIQMATLSVQEAMGSKLTGKRLLH